MKRPKRFAAVLALVVTSILIARPYLGTHFTAFLEDRSVDQTQELRIIETKLTQAHRFAEVLVLQLESEDHRQIVVNLEATGAADTALQTYWSRTAATLVVTETEIGAMSDKVVVIIVHPAGSNDQGDDLFIENHDVAALRAQVDITQPELSADFAPSAP